jgi:hypothetical protein
MRLKIEIIFLLTNSIGKSIVVSVKRDRSLVLVSVPCVFRTALSVFALLIS